ncbi:MAG: substrate-binding domain-containing protein [Magnetococcales bacterium]|nr:substrate-binding domain-containing protein [Magnetococcales bacterium]
MLGSGAWAETIRVSGTGTLMSAVRQITEAYRQHHPELQFQFYYPPIGSSGAIKALTNGQLDLALTGRPLKTGEEESGLVQEWLGRSPFLFVVHQKAAVRQTTLDQMVEIYAGRQKAWPDGSRIRVILRPLADADTALLAGLSPGMRQAIATAHANRPPGAALADTDIDLADMVEKVQGGIGSVALALILAEKRPLKGLIMDGVEPTVAALERGAYPHAKPAYLVIRADASPAVRAVVDFLRSEDGKSLLSRFGISTIRP